ncbi:unnamed protein product [Ectocarpus sp. 8 AP-2014]
MAYLPARRRRRPQHHHHDSSSATGRRTRRLTVVLLALFSVNATTATAHTPSVPFSPGGSSIFQGVDDNSPLARTMKGAAGSARIAGWAGRGDPYTVAAPGAEPLKLSHGTTTVALVCDGGVIAAVDSRASMGSFVGSRTTQKARLGEGGATAVIPVSQHILGTMAGGAADCTFWLRYLGMQAKVFEDQNGFQMPVATAARVLADALLGQRGKGLSVGTMIMGHDRGNRDSSGRGSVSGGNQGGGQLYYVDSDGARVKGRYFSVGSGSTYAYSVLDEGYRDNMSLEEAADLAKRAVRHATYRDAFSGEVQH